MRITLKQIAEQVGVSVNTVSLALRNMPGVNAATKEQIFSAANQLGYVFPKEKLKNPKNLCLVSTRPHLEDSYFYMAFQQLIVDHAQECGYHMLVKDNDFFDTDQAELRQRLNTNSICGVLILGDIEEKIALHILQCSVPVVATGTRYIGLNISTYIEDNDQVAYQAVRYLYDQGLRKIGFIGDPLYSVSFMARYQGYCGALKTLDLPYDEQFLFLKMRPGIMNSLDKATGMFKAIQQLPEAFFCANDYLGLIAIKVFHNLGISVPKDISLVGVDNSPLGKIAIPSITSVDVHCHRQAFLSVNKLISFVEGTPYDSLQVLVPSSLCIGESVRLGAGE
ncbi:MAG: LacI family transcriptional regulator [Spirochaetia bacterium]|nr:LacI family transcriptional regulator [Spirochaetia bacterium]